MKCLDHPSPSRARETDDFGAAFHPPNPSGKDHGDCPKPPVEAQPTWEAPGEHSSSPRGTTSAPVALLPPISPTELSRIPSVSAQVLEDAPSAGSSPMLQVHT